jgi:hypothetical protein
MSAMVLQTWYNFIIVSFGCRYSNIFVASTPRLGSNNALRPEEKTTFSSQHVSQSSHHPPMIDRQEQK